MHYLRAKHPAIAWCLIPWFVEGNQTREEIFMELYGRLEQDPDNVYIDIALEGEICKGVLIATKDDDGVWVWQARKSDGFKKSKEMFSRMVDWAKESGATSLRLKTDDGKLEKLYSRRYGFAKSGDYMEKAI